MSTIKPIETKIIVLGGLGEVGKNMYCVMHGDEIVIIDAGVNSKITKEEIIEIFKTLKLHEKIMSLPKGYQTNIYEAPDLLSTGERQMISFARIMAMSPDVVILDEVTSTLSWENEELVKNAMDKVAKRKDCFYDCS